MRNIRIYIHDYTSMCSTSIHSSTTFTETIFRFARMFHNIKRYVKKKAFSYFLNSPPQSTHPCWEANVFLSAFQVSSLYVAQNDLATQWQWSKGSFFSHKKSHYTKFVICFHTLIPLPQVEICIITTICIFKFIVSIQYLILYIWKFLCWNGRFGLIEYLFTSPYSTTEYIFLNVIWQHVAILITILFVALCTVHVLNI